MIGGTNGCMGKIGESMFGMPLEGEMLESFAAEFGNMLAGNIATSLTDEDALIDITPPTVIVGDTKMDRFHEAIHLPTSLEGVGPLQVTLLIEM
ncbi:MULTISPECIES: chemotaxis protein CheC [Peribacillus]|uniref:chemotaxis protein CheC n=1 Tax=Peribacillus TaxID=2675229 RepID=UPI001F4E30D6|nr:MULTISPECIES: chemotaxis protein CheC [unclassified Peribacillus]MCK1982500.1 chemotaxis protein CheC [Peribacillus sp. Aquil_B1]MCK2008009.1 chemotaxis protein CheC [Peribacillus sp. Aquil_B8]